LKFAIVGFLVKSFFEIVQFLFFGDCPQKPKELKHLNH